MGNQIIKIYAPVVIPTLCRYEHFKRCVESLSKCTGADRTELYIGLDYPTKESHWSGYNKICDYLPSIRGFQAVHVYKREVNYGQSKNTRNLLEIVKEGYDRYILSEDDNEFSPNFLEYINKGLELYKDHPDVMAICGYSYPIEYFLSIGDYNFNAYPIQGYTAWGVGFWFDKRDSVVRDFVNSENAYQLIHSWKSVKKLFRKKMHITVHRLLFRWKESYGDLMWCCLLNLYDKYCIFPTVSKVRNHGFDKSASHCVENPIYEKQEIDLAASFDYDDIEIRPYKSIIAMHNKKYGGAWWIRKLCELEYLFFRLFGITFQGLFVRLRLLSQRNRM